MAGRVAVVTDSTAYLPADVVAAHCLTLVPLQVVIDGTVYDEDEAPRELLVDALRRHAPVTTSRPAPGALLSAYVAAAAAGAASVVSVHLSGAVSGTFESAVLAAQQAPLPVRAVDSRQLGMGLGFAVLAAAAAAARGAGMEEAAQTAASSAAGTAAYFYVEDLEHLRRGGRLRAAQALLASALSVKPLLHLVHGRVELLERVRTRARAITRLEDLAVQRAAAGPVQLAVHHLDSPGRAGELADRLRQRVPATTEVQVGEVGAVVGAHTGPGMLAVVIAPADASR
jgi:DegV family protein with EDD domain